MDRNIFSLWLNRKKFNAYAMNAKYLTLFCTAFALATSSSVAVAQSSSDPTQVKLSPPMLTLLCKEFPLNSRCNSSTAPSTSAPNNTTQPNTSPSGSSTEPNTTSPSSTTQPSTNVPNNTTGPRANSPNNTSGPGTTKPPVGTPPAPGSQNKPYVTPQ
jgi:hypothetical protein